MELKMTVTEVNPILSVVSEFAPVDLALSAEIR